MNFETAPQRIKLNPKTAIKIRHLAKTHKQADLARKYGVSRSTITQILQRKIYS